MSVTSRSTPPGAPVTVDFFLVSRPADDPEVVRRSEALRWCPESLLSGREGGARTGGRVVPPEARLELTEGAVVVLWEFVVVSLRDECRPEETPETLRDDFRPGRPFLGKGLRVALCERPRADDDAPARVAESALVPTESVVATVVADAFPRMRDRVDIKDMGNGAARWRSARER